MEQVVRVRRLLDDGMAEVVRVRESACSGDCHQCSGCGAVSQAVFLRAKNLVGAQPGDLVQIESESKPVLQGAALLYLLPLALFLTGYLLGAYLWGTGIWFGAGAFGLSLIPIRCYDRYLERKKIVYTITALAGNKPAENERKRG